MMRKIKLAFSLLALLLSLTLLVFGIYAIAFGSWGFHLVTLLMGFFGPIYFCLLSLYLVAECISPH